jgi:hypothetical protein
MREMWTYYGVNVYPADMNCSGIRWTARFAGLPLRADSKDGMRELIRHSR